MAGGAAVQAAATADACSALTDGERTKSEQKGNELRDAWNENLNKLRQEWEQRNQGASSAGGTGTSVPDGAIPPDVKSKADEMLEDLGTYLDLLNHSQTAADACAELTGRYKGETSDVKKVCTVLVKVVNWMGGLTANGVEKKNKISEQNWVQYLRCVIGYEVILRTLTKKCKAQRMLKIISDTMEKGGSKPTGPNVSSICPWVKLEDIGDNEGSIGNEVQKWLNKAKGGSSGGGIRGFDNIVAWYRCTEKEEEEGKAKQKAQTCQSDRIMDLMKGGMSHQLNVLVDPIAAANDCIEKAQTDKNSNALCNRLKCIDDYLKKQPPPTPSTAAPQPGASPGGPQSGPGQPSATEKFWKEGDGDVANLWKELSRAMTNKGTNGDDDCNKLDNPSSEAACKYLHAGLKQLYEGSSLSGNNGILSMNNPSFRQTMGCFLLHAYAKHMKEKAVCNIDKGISKAFDLGQGLSKTGTSCTNGSSCIECKWDEKWGECDVPVGTTGTNQTKVKDKVEKIIEKDNTNIPTMLKNINTMSTLCNYMECIASHLNATDAEQKYQNVDKFWEKNTGEVGQLWGELQGAMMEESVNGAECNTMDDNGQPRTPTEPEKKACQHLTTFFKKLKEITASKGTDNKIFDEHPLLKRAMGCFLLKEYAKKMKEKSTCVIEAGLKKAFDWWNQNKGNCQNGSSGTELCVPCQWEDKEYGDCQITTNGKEKKKVTEKLDKVKGPIDGHAGTIMRDVNITDSLCDKLQCAAGKWFQSKAGNSGSNKKSWCGFWKEGVGGALKTMFEQIAQNGADKSKNNTGICKDFGDGNDDSVERRACNHITAGLEHIKNISSGSGNGNDQLLARAVGCIALNMYADKIIKLTENSCPIDETTINKMFSTWNDQNNKPSSSPPCNGGANNKDCFLCNRVQTSQFENCKLSVDSNLINTPSQSNGTCDNNTGRDKVHDEINKFLEDNNQSTSSSKSIPQVKSTLTSITNITKSSFCTQLQCAAKQYQAKSKNGKISPWDGFWEETGEVVTLWQELSKAMTENGGQDNGGPCGTMEDGTGRTPTNPEKRACNYLHAGLKQLYEPDSSSGTTNNGILSGHPSLRRTLGCLLLKKYAEKMKDTSTCVIDSGIEKAFKAWNASSNGKCSGTEPCVPCEWEEKHYEDCKINTNGSPTPVKNKLTPVQDTIDTTATNTLTNINEMSTLCEYIRCAGPKWFKNHNPVGNSGAKKDWCDFWEKEGVKPELKTMFNKIATDGQNKSKNDTNDVCKQFGDENPQSVERKACNHITAGLEHIRGITGEKNGSQHKDDNQLFERTVGCIALNMYADQIIAKSKDICPIDESKIQDMFTKWNDQNKNSCKDGVNGCFECKRDANFGSCNLLVDKDLIGTTPSQSQNGQNCNDNDGNKKVQEKMTKLLNNEDYNPSQSNPNSIKSNITTTLSTITEMASSFCTQLQCAAKKWKSAKNQHNSGQSTDVKWSDIHNDATTELAELLKDMNDPKKQKTVTEYCNDDSKWSKLGHTERRTNRAACLHFAAGLQHIYTHGNGRVNGPSFGQTMGCLFLKEYAKQLKDLAKKEKRYKVHPRCSVDSGIEYAFSKSSDIMKSVLTQCQQNASTNDCFVCTQNNDYNNCKIGDDNIGSKSKELFTEPNSKKHMQQTLENTVCPILLTDILTPFLPLAPVSIGLSAMAYYLWKYFGPLGKGGPRFRRSPTEIPGSSVQEQVLDHVQQDSSHEYRLVKERKPRSVPARTKRSGGVNRRTIIEIHFEVLDECQKGDTQLNQKDFLELLVQEFMGSELMEEEQVPMEDVLMEGVPMERVPIEEFPSLGSGFMV
ncbi:SICAvar, type I [Plasmodium knowlesi strain H]|uniref:SICAvar, type I n=3 Tax=Plasmodium knowlesi TaxID=5850 RepID=B3L022_PLAKH|nr:SICAvar, type I [Plasmodium knowlesi strain H]OTN68486.1 SICAvar type I [Plasmodium knowlesi]CAA9986501.1 SICAvar, type I [Plasmodium knowlesi strain H]SBO24240.1 SICAvar, type I [Plasmodium knowlesi strain H]VVS75975.1 SICAvar, type I [Plasmodium knowlesi strain H]|eukprot:XP_002261052.1 SICA antigen [Plasmodium knowlesi strain H]